MLTRVLLRAHGCRSLLMHQARRNLGVSAVCCQTAAQNLDPIQKLFLDKIKDYAQKSKAAGGGLVDATPESQKPLLDDLDKIARIYGATGTDFTKFPSFSFADPDLQPTGVGFDPVEEKKDAVVEERLEVEANPEDEKPFWEP